MKIWTDPEFEEFPPNAKYLFVYLITNSHRNESALYSLSYKRISSETGMSLKTVMTAMGELMEKEKVRYDPITSTVWVVNAVKHQTLNDNCIKSILRDLEFCSSPPLSSAFASFYNDFKGLQGVVNGFVNPSIGIREQGIGTKEQGIGIGTDKEIKSKDIFISTPFPGNEDFKKVWEEYRDHRKQMRKTMTAVSELKALSNLVKLSLGNPGTAIEIVNQSIANGWQGLFELKKANIKQKSFETKSQYEQERKCPDCGKPVMAMYWDQHREKCRAVATSPQTAELIKGIGK